MAEAMQQYSVEAPERDLTGLRQTWVGLAATFEAAKAKAAKALGFSASAQVKVCIWRDGVWQRVD